MLFEIKGLTKNFRRLVAVSDINLQMETNEQCVIGPNGAGQDDGFNLVTGIYRPTSGSVILQEGYHRSPPHEIGRLGIARIQNLRLFRACQPSKRDYGNAASLRLQFRFCTLSNAGLCQARTGNPPKSHGMP